MLVFIMPAAFLKIIHRAHSEPTKKYSHPMTESQEIGWISAPLVRLKVSENARICCK